MNSAAYNGNVLNSAAYNGTVLNSAAYNGTVLNSAAYNGTVLNSQVLELLFFQLVNHIDYQSKITGNQRKNLVNYTNYQFRKILVNCSKLKEIKTISTSQDYHDCIIYVQSL